MPEKEGAEEKSTKSVVNKKQKQMMGEEGYDIARDMGRVRPSKDKKDATTMPVSDEVKKTQKVNKGPSAFERVKAKYGKSVMNVGKKKVKEELDLTQVAEALGGYIVEANGKKKDDGSKKLEKTRSIDRFMQAADPFNPPSEEELAFQQFKKEAEAEGEKVRPPERGELKKGGPIKKETPAKRAKAAADALSDIKSDTKIMGKPTPSVKRGVEKEVKKGDPVQKQRDALTKRVSDRSALRGTKKAQRDAMATGGKTTGSLSKGNLEFPGDRSGATSQAKFDMDFQKALKKQGGTGDIGFNAPDRKTKIAIRQARAKQQGTPDPFDIPTKKVDDVPQSLKDVPKNLKRFAQLSQDIKSLKQKMGGGTRSFSSMNPSERERAFGAGGSTEGSGGAGGSTPVSPIKPVANPTYKQFQQYADQARRDQDKLRAQRDALRDPTGMDKDEIKRVNKQVQGAVDAEKRYTDAAQGKGSSTSAIVPTTTTDKKGKTQETPISAYLRTQRGGAIKRAERGGSIVKRSADAYSKFAKNNPALGGVAGLAGYDIGKGILGKIKKGIVGTLNVQKSTKTGRISAGT